MDHLHDEILQQARGIFPAFYKVATTDDETWFDALVLAHVRMNLAMRIPRMFHPVRRQLERECNEVEQRFMNARDKVRECPTFRALAAGDRKRIEAVLFEVFPSTA